VRISPPAAREIGAFDETGHRTIEVSLRDAFDGISVPVD
jgi:hypothetical protein